MVAFSAAVVFTGSVFGQWAPKSVDVDFTETAIVIDGIADDVWADVAAQDIDVPYAAEEVSFTGTATFKALWDNDNVYVIVTVPDDNNYDHIAAGVDSWLADKPEIYFDVTLPLVDSGGPSDDAGHYQAAPDFDPAMPAQSYTYGFLVDASDAGYVYEYAFPYTWLTDADGVALDPRTVTTIGFDVTIIDLDETGLGGNDGGLGRINWSNNTTDKVEGGEAGESWVSLDQAGAFNFVGAPSSVSNATVNNTMVYPNVASANITINVEASEYSIINSLGQVVMVSEDNVINISSLETGVYFVKANNQVARILKK